VRFCVEWAQQLFPNALLDIENDTRMRDLSDAAKKGSESEVPWRMLREMWLGSELPANPTKTITGAEIANHHATAILNSARAAS
jgi:hypothetical protein